MVKNAEIAASFSLDFNCVIAKHDVDVFDMFDLGV